MFGLLQRTKADRLSRIKLTVVPNVRRGAVLLEAKKGVQRGSTLYTDALKSYEWPNKWGPQSFVHKVIDHAESYVDGIVHTNGMENFWSLLKRTLRGTYVSVEPFHLFRYLDEQAFRFNERGLTDSERFEQVAKAVVGKRLTYRALTGRDLPESLAG